ncbi:MAG: hypothetical protein RLZZ627_202 [Pseudomonadota bacterium]|jgi:cobalt-zinc-cadmium resistance protein CzcA
MVPNLIRLALQYRWGVIGGTLVVMLLGGWAFSVMKIDAYPDISAQMVQVITTFPGRAPEEVERQVTIPVEIAMRNVPKVETIRSRTIFGLSVVQMIFEEGTESYWARQRVQEKLTSVEMPDGAEADLGPLATAYGEVLRYELISDGRLDNMDLRTLNDWVVIPKLLRTPGVAEVSNFGGYAKQYAVLLHPSQLQRYGLSVNDIADAIQTNNASAGGSVLSRGSMSFVIRGRGSLQNADEIGSIFVRSLGGTPIYIRDVADVQLDAKIPAGIFSKDLRDEAVEGIVLLRRGENPSDVLHNVQMAIQELNIEGLPDGAQIKPYYDRSFLINSTLHTVSHSVLLGIGLVVLILLGFFGKPSMALLVGLTIPFSLLIALLLMYLAGIPIGLLSIGAIDFGIIVDGAVVVTENIARRLDERKEDGLSARDVIYAAALEVERPVFFSLLMILGAFLPLLTLTHIEGLLFRPMAMTIVFALAGALIAALIIVPVLATFFFRDGFKEWHNPVVTWLTIHYRRILETLLIQRNKTLMAALFTLVMVGIGIVPRLGSEFLPYMDEGVIWVRANFPEGTSLQQTASFGRRLREIALSFQDIQFAVAQTGRNDSGTDPFPPSRIEMMVGPKPKDSWKQFSNKHDLLKALGESFRGEFPTVRFNFTQPIIDSVTEDANGTSASMAIEFTGADSGILLELARRSEGLLKQVPGALDVNIEQEGPQPQLLIEPDRSLCARYDVRIEDVTRMIDTAIGGSPVGNLFEAERRFDIVTRFAPEHILSPQAIGRLPVYNENNIAIPLAQVAKISIMDGQTIIARADGRRRMTVRSDIVGRDQGGFVADAQERFAREIKVPQGYKVSWLGMFDNLARAKKHFQILVPTTIGLIYLLLLATFRSQRDAVILLMAVPFAFVGGALALYLRGMNMNVSAGVGFAAVFGVSIMDGVLMLRSINTVRSTGTDIDQTIIEAATLRLRPILITALVAILGLVPASLATGLGSDVQRPLATVIVWGLFSATLMTLFIIPVLYRYVEQPIFRFNRNRKGVQPA